MTKKTIKEGLHEDLKKIYNSFEQYIKSHRMVFDIHTDEGGYQSYFVPKDHADEIAGLRDHMEVEADRNGVHMQVRPSKRGTQFIFSVMALNELEEDQYKSPTRKHLRDQSMFPSSFDKSRTFGGVSGYNGKKDKKRKKRLEESIDKALEEL